MSKIADELPAPMRRGKQVGPEIVVTEQFVHRARLVRKNKCVTEIGHGSTGNMQLPLWVVTYIHTWLVTMYGYSTSFFSPSGPKGDFRRRNLFSLEIRGVYGVFPRRAGPQARGPGEPFGQDRLKSGSAFFNIIPQTSPKQNCSPERASIWPACVLHLLVLCPLVAHAP